MIRSFKRAVARLQSRIGRAVEGRQQARIEELVEPLADTESPNADPRLAGFLTDGPDEQFEQVRQDAIDALSQSDVVAIWLQAIGDGTPLDHARENAIEQRTPHNVLSLAGYDDDLTHPEISQIVLQLFTHHVCVFTSVPRRRSPAAGIEAFEQQGREAIRNTLDLSTAAAEQMYVSANSDSDIGTETVADLFEPRSLVEQRERAIAILDQEELATFWVQVMTRSELVSLHIPGIDEAGQPTIDKMPDSPVEYFQARPTNADFELAQQLAMETAGQHHYVAATALEQPIESIAEQAIEMALESGYTLEIDSL